MKTETINFDTAKGSTTAYVAAPDGANAESKGILIIQEYWGLNDHIRDIAERYAEEGYVAIAPDLYHGRLAKTSEEAGLLMQSLETEDGLEIIDKAIIAAQEKYGLIKFGITGFCMGGTYALEAACKLENIHGAAPFYGDIPDEFTLKGLKCPVIFFSATKDKWINPEKVGELERLAKANNLPVESVKYEADHAFFNNTRPEVYDGDAAKDAWQRVLKFFSDNLENKSNFAA